ncbi:hypothetical protein D9M71_614850 [compost metagenome]
MHLVMARHLQLAVQQAALLVALHRDVQVVEAADRKLRQQGVTVVAMGVHGIAAVGELRPHAVGQELVLRRIGPGRLAQGVLLVATVHFLEKHQVGTRGANGFAQLGQDETPVEEGKALVHVQRQDIQPTHGGNLVDDAARGGQGPVHRATSGTTPGSVISSWSSDSFCSRRRAS